MNDMSEANYRVTADELRQFIERFERLEMEKKIFLINKKRLWPKPKGVVMTLKLCEK